MKGHAAEETLEKGNKEGSTKDKTSVSGRGGIGD